MKIDQILNIIHYLYLNGIDIHFLGMEKIPNQSIYSLPRKKNGYN